MSETATGLTDVVESWTEATIVSALLHFGLTLPTEGSNCVDALRKIGHDQAADMLAGALAERNG